MWGSWENLWPVRAVGAGRRIEWVGANGSDLEALVRASSEECA